MKLIVKLLFYYKACAVGVRKHDLKRCDEIYTELGTRIFSKPKDRQDGETSWKDRFDNLYRDGQQKWRVAVHGSKHDANVFESLLQQESEMDGKQESFIESSLRGGPKVFVVGTLYQNTLRLHTFKLSVSGDY